MWEDLGEKEELVGQGVLEEQDWLGYWDLQVLRVKRGHLVELEGQEGQAVQVGLEELVGQEGLEVWEHRDK